MDKSKQYRITNRHVGIVGYAGDLWHAREFCESFLSSNGGALLVENTLAGNGQAWQYSARLLRGRVVLHGVAYKHVCSCGHVLRKWRFEDDGKVYWQYGGVLDTDSTDLIACPNCEESLPDTW